MSATPAEYQHYIPQFLLRNFSYPFHCPEAEGGGRKKGRKCKCKHEKGKYPNDPVLNCVNLTSTPIHHEVRPVKRVFGLANMYDDKTKPTTAEQQRIEKKFSKMESQASTIFRRMVKAHEGGEEGIILTRIERDLIRKFLFLLKYRGCGFHNRFHHASVDEYSANDRAIMLEYMRAKGFKTPLDVWFHNLEAIMDIDMGPDIRWMLDLSKKMFPPDARWFFMHAQAYYMAMCTPSDESEEFVLTDNCFNVFEGPSTFARDERTGEIIPSSYAGFHEFAPISPRLMIILRSSTLPNPLEDANPKIKKQRDDERWSAIGQVYGPMRKSLFANLPVHKAKTSYVQIINGGYYAVKGFDGKLRPNDTFIFNFFRIKRCHVQNMNNILLDNTYSCTAIAFRSHAAFFKTLESYISGPCDSGKIIGGNDAGLRLKFLRKLEALARNMGSTKPLSYKFMEEVPTIDGEAYMRRYEEFHFMGLSADEGGKGSDTALGFMKLYASIVGMPFKEAFSNLQSDISQSSRMLHLEIMVRESDMGFDQRMLLTSYYRNSPPQRFWLYLKQIRRLEQGMAGWTQDFVDFFTDPEWQNGPEDIFAKTHELYSHDVLKELMQVSVYNHVDRLAVRSLRTVWQGGLEEKEDLVELARLWKFVFGRPGPITQCGIPKIEELAEQEQRALCRRIRYVHRVIDNPDLVEEDKIELVTRMHVRAKFRDVLRDEIDASLLAELEEVFFDLTFPTPPIKMSAKG